jgi:predicted DNA-binding protein
MGSNRNKLMEVNAAQNVRRMNAVDATLAEHDIAASSGRNSSEQEAAREITKEASNDAVGNTAEQQTSKEEAKDKITYSIRISKEVGEYLDIAVFLSGMTRSGFVEKLIEEDVEKHKAEYDMQKSIRSRFKNV